MIILGYSGSDINLVCKEAVMRPLRRIFNALDLNIIGEVKEKEGTAIPERELISQLDIEASITSTHPSCDPKMNQKYIDRQNSFGSV